MFAARTYPKGKDPPASYKHPRNSANNQSFAKWFTNFDDKFKEKQTNDKQENRFQPDAEPYIKGIIIETKMIGLAVFFVFCQPYIFFHLLIHFYDFVCAQHHLYDDRAIKTTDNAKSFSSPKRVSESKIGPIPAMCRTATTKNCLSQLQVLRHFSFLCIASIVIFYEAHWLYRVECQTQINVLTLMSE